MSGEGRESVGGGSLWAAHQLKKKPCCLKVLEAGQLVQQALFVFHPVVGVCGYEIVGAKGRPQDHEAISQRW